MFSDYEDRRTVAVIRRAGTLPNLGLRVTRGHGRGFRIRGFLRTPLTRFLMGLRTLVRRKGSERGCGTQLERLRRTGFIELARLPRQEIVLGVVGRFWRIDSGIITGDIQACLTSDL